MPDKQSILIATSREFPRLVFICSCIKIGDNRLIDRLLRCDYERVTTEITEKTPFR